MADSVEKRKRARNRNVAIRDTIPEDLSFADLELSKEELLFVGLVCTEGFHKSADAYREAFGVIATGRITDKQARSRGLQIMGKENVRSAITKFIDHFLTPFQERFELQQMQFWQARAMWNPKDIFNDNGDLKPLDKIPEESLFAIDGVNVDYRGKDADRRVTTYKMANRAEAMKQLKDFVKTGRPSPASKKEADTQDRVRGILDAGKKQLKEGMTGKARIERITERVVIDDDDTGDDSEDVIVQEAVHVDDDEN